MEKILYRVYSSRGASLSLRIISHASVLLTVVAYGMLVVSSYLDDPILMVKILVSGAVPFVLVSVLRRLINAPRPYEMYEFYKEAPKSKKGSSFPSRHVFSCFTVAVLCYILSPILAVAIAVTGALLSVSRVLLGIHFVRDVVTGAIIGILSGLLGLVLIVL
jgi:membrane-associated phospholipid phosphatase